MATHKSAEKRARQSVRRNKVNRARKSLIHTLIRKFEAALSGKDAKAAADAMREVESALARGARKGAMPKKTASRKTSRLARRLKGIKKG